MPPAPSSSSSATSIPTRPSPGDPSARIRLDPPGPPAWWDGPPGPLRATGPRHQRGPAPGARQERSRAGHGGIRRILGTPGPAPQPRGSSGPLKAFPHFPPKRLLREESVDVSRISIPVTPVARCHIAPWGFSLIWGYSRRWPEFPVKASIAAGLWPRARADTWDRGISRISRSFGCFRSSKSALRRVQGQHFPKNATERREFPSLQFSACFRNKNFAAEPLFPKEFHLFPISHPALVARDRSQVVTELLGPSGLRREIGATGLIFGESQSRRIWGRGSGGVWGSLSPPSPRAGTRRGHPAVAAGQSRSRPRRSRPGGVPAEGRGRAGGDFWDPPGKGLRPQPHPIAPPTNDVI